MSYERAMEILQKDPTTDSEQYDYFLTLTEAELDEIFECLSEEHEHKIMQYLQKKNHTPSRSKARPEFIDSVKLAHSRVKFTDPRIEPVVKKEGNELQQIMATKKQVAEYVYNYPYYEIIRRMLATLIDTEPQPQVVKALHSNLQTMFRMLLNAKLIKGLIDNLSIRRGSYLLDSKPLRGKKKQSKLDLVHFKDYLSEIFEKECRSFRKFMEKTKKVTVNADIEDNLSEVNSVSSLENDRSESSSASDGQDSSIEDVDDIEHSYFLLRTNGMSVEEFQQYSDNRTVNFMAHGIQKLSRFVDSKQVVLPAFKNKDLYKLISYVLCRSLRQIVFRVICAKNKGVLQPVKNLELKIEDVSKIGMEYIERIAKRGRTYALKFSTYLRKAQALFGQEFEEMGYDKILVPNYMRIKLIKGSEGDIKSPEVWQQAWRRNRNRKLWFERVQAESQYKLHLQKKTTPKKFVNGYAEYLFSQCSEKKELRDIFREYYRQTQQVQLTTLSSQPATIVPNQKLQSLFDD